MGDQAIVGETPNLAAALFGIAEPNKRIGCEPWPERANLIPTLGVPDDRGLRIGNAGNTHAPTRPGVCSFLRARRASEFGIAKPATYCARFFHTAENEKQLRARDVPTLPCSIGLLSRKLRHSVRNWIVSAASKKTRQFNFIAFSLAQDLAQALLGRNDPMLREVLASSITQLEESLQQSRGQRGVYCPVCEGRPGVKGSHGGALSAMRQCLCYRRRKWRKRYSG